MSYSPSVLANITSSVSPEFPNGLHRQYLNYIANKMNMKLDVQPMPFARRLKQLEIGKLDILVAVIKRTEANSNLIYLKPSYEQVSSSFFVLKRNQHRLTKSSDLKDMVVAITYNAMYFTEFQQIEELSKIPVSSLEQKIKLLQKGRVGTFVHYQQSTLSTLSKMNLADEIVLADFQSKAYEDHYFVITEMSALYPYKAKLEQIIKQGMAEGDFAQIRRNYYQKNKD